MHKYLSTNLYKKKCKYAFQTENLQTVQNRICTKLVFFQCWNSLPNMKRKNSLNTAVTKLQIMLNSFRMI